MWERTGGLWELLETTILAFVGKGRRSVPSGITLSTCGGASKEAGISRQVIGALLGTMEIRICR
jgi:hypothetical protein